MAVLGRLLVSSAERLDLPDLLSLDSYAAGDWKYFLKGIVGDSKPYILKGFDVIDPGNAIGTQSCSIRVADSITFYPGSSTGSFYHGLPEGNSQALPLVPELRKNAVNYVYLTFSTFNTSTDTRAFWDPDKDGGAGGEFTQDVNTESVLDVQVNVSTGSFPANTVPVAKITVGPVVITAIEDARDMMFRLGSGGVNPDPFNNYGWRSLPSAPYQRNEPPTIMQAGGINPFQGGDKNILSLKEWMDVVMTRLRELGGSTHWYDDTSTFGVITGFFDAVATTFKSKGQWVHDTVTPGLLTWTEDVQVKMTADPRTYILRQGSATLANEQVLYIPMVRNQPVNSLDQAVSWTNGQAYVNTVGGAVGFFGNLAKGDYVKKINDSFDKWLRVEEFYDAINLGGSTTTAAGARSIRLSSIYLGTTEVQKGRYDKGAYLAADATISDRNNSSIFTTGGNFHWLALRSDTIENTSNIVSHTLSLAISEHDGSTAKVTSTAHGLVDGDRFTISGTTNFNGTYKVEVETADIFYITKSGGPFANESGSGFYATVTTSARSTLYGFQEESANHGFRSDDTVIISSTTNYNNSYLINVTGSTTFTIPISTSYATETSGLATVAKLMIRSEGTGLDLIQGQVIDIGGSVADNIRQYLGMSSLSQTAPAYAIVPGYNTIDGMQNYNGTVNENLTARVSKLTAMMADKAQDKTIKYNYGTGLTTVNNTTNGAAQEVTFDASGSTLYLVTPGSTGQAAVSLPFSSPGVSLLVNQAAYVTIDRNNATTPSIVVANIADVPVDENVFVLLTRLSATDIYLWDGHPISIGAYVLEKANRNLDNLLAPTKINQDLLPDFYTDANNRKIGSSVKPFTGMRSTNYKSEGVVYTLTGDFSTSSFIVTNVAGTLPAYTGTDAIYTIYAPGYTHEGGVIFTSPTTLTMDNGDFALQNGTGITFYLTAATVLTTDDQALKTGAIAMVSGDSSTSGSGLLFVDSGTAAVNAANLTFQGIVYTSFELGKNSNYASVKNLIDASLVTQTSGAVVANRVYLITSSTAPTVPNDFSNVGGSVNMIAGSLFLATNNNTPTNYGDAVLQPIVTAQLGAGFGFRLLNRIPSTLTRDQLLTAVTLTSGPIHNFTAVSAGGANVVQVNGEDYFSGAIEKGSVIIGDNTNTNTGFFEIGANRILLSGGDTNNGNNVITNEQARGVNNSNGMVIRSGDAGGSGNTGSMNFRSADNIGSGGSGSVTMRSGNVFGNVNSGSFNINTGANNQASTANTGAGSFVTGSVNGISGNSGQFTAGTGNIANTAAAGSNSGATNIVTGTINVLTSTTNSGALNVTTGNNLSTSTGSTGAIQIASGVLSGAGSGNTGSLTLATGNKTAASSTGNTGNASMGSGSINTAGFGASGNTLVNSGNITINSTSQTSGAVVSGGLYTILDGSTGGNFTNVGGSVNPAINSTFTASASLTPTSYGNYTIQRFNTAGAVTLSGGAATGTSGNTGAINIVSGGMTGINTTALTTGQVFVRSGVQSNTLGNGKTGAVTVATGDNSGFNLSGNVIVRSGDAGKSSTGNTTITTGAVNGAPTQTSGLLVFGKTYIITTILGADDFTNAGASSNTNGTIFIATRTTPAVWASSSVITPYASSGQLTLNTGNVNAGTAPSGNITLNTGTSSGGASGQVFVNTGNETGANASGQITVATGTTVNGNSGDILLNVAIPSGTGVKGKIRLGNSSTSGYIWTANDTGGGGNWADPYSPSNTAGTAASIANNQVAAANVTGLLFSGATYRSFTTEYWVYRTTTTNEIAESGVIRGVYSTTAATWQISIGGIAGDAQIDFTITAGGQLQYTSSNLAGASYTGNMRFATLVKIPV